MVNSDVFLLTFSAIFQRLWIGVKWVGIGYEVGAVNYKKEDNNSIVPAGIAVHAFCHKNPVDLFN